MLTSIALVVCTASSALLAQYIIAALLSPLRNIFPGPFWAHFSNLWRFLNVKRHHELQIALHRKYGPAVRFGPNMISLADPALIRTIYDTRGTYRKSDFYSPMDALGPDGSIIQNSFGTRDNQWHTAYLKPISGFYRDMKHVLSLEPRVDDTLRLLCEKLDQHAVSHGKTAPVDLARQILFFAFDAVGDMTFSSRLGFLEQNDDAAGHIRTAENGTRFFAATSQMPILDRLLTKNRVFRFGERPFDWAINFAVEKLQERFKENEELRQAGQSKERVDHLDMFMQLPDTPPEIAISYTMQNILAGADTVAITLQTALFHVLKNPSVHKRLTQELLEAPLSFPASFREASLLPYLEAVINEALRIAPAIGMSLERIVPAGGLTLLDGRFIPQGTLVGLNPWVTNRDSVYGADVDSFKPERWLQHQAEDEVAFQERLQAMRSASLAFGAGKRVCLGKNLADLEVYKTIATLFSAFEISLLDPECRLEQPNNFFTFVESPINVHLQRRGGNASAK